VLLVRRTAAVAELATAARRDLVVSSGARRINEVNRPRPPHHLSTVAAITILRYDTRCYFNVRSKEDMSQLNLPHGNDNQKV